jgi:hypothetical protein
MQGPEPQAASASHRPSAPLSYSRALTPANAEGRPLPQASKSPSRPRSQASELPRFEHHWHTVVNLRDHAFGSVMIIVQDFNVSPIRPIPANEITWPSHRSRTPPRRAAFTRSSHRMPPANIVTQTQHLSRFATVSPTGNGAQPPLPSRVAN